LEEREKERERERERERVREREKERERERGLLVPFLHLRDRGVVRNREELFTYPRV
jgi:hypothetical protein